MKMKKIKGKRRKFLIAGIIITLVNLVAIHLLIELLNFNTPFLRNIANIISIEFSLLLGFFIYRILVWKGGSWRFTDLLLKQLPLYHISASLILLIRIFVIFPLLDWWGISYIINTIIGVLVSACINYMISDRLLLTKYSPSEIFSPEGLELAVQSSEQQKQNTYFLRDDNEIRLLSIVIPAYNEEGCIIPTIESIRTLLESQNINYEILVVNDNSRDCTEELLQYLSAKNSKVSYLNNYYPNGFGFAVRCGLENFRGDAVAIVMADSSDSPENILDYYYKLQEGYDCIFGSRFIRGGKVVEYPTHKLIINRLANLFIKILFDLDLNDTTNAFKIYRREVIEGISPLISHHFNLTVEIPLKSIIRGYSYAIIPISWQNRKQGISKLKIKEMGSRYLFIVLYILLEKYLSRGDYVKKIHKKKVMS